MTSSTKLFYGIFNNSIFDIKIKKNLKQTKTFEKIPKK